MTTKTEDTKADPKAKAGDTADFQNGVPLLPKASNAKVPAAKTSQDNQDNKKDAPVVGMPEGYKPDTSSSYVKGKAEDGSEDQIHGEDGKKTAVKAFNANSAPVLETLPKDHTYRDRVEAQAKSLGVPIVEGETLELLLWKIRVMASS